MAEVTLEVQEYFNNSWDWLDYWLVVDSGNEVHWDARHLLDESGDVTVQHKLRTFDATDNIDMHDALDASHHPHMDDFMDERAARRKRTDETEEARANRRKLKPATHSWSLKYNYIFLFFWNFVMLFVYYIADFLDGVPRAVWFIIVILHISAIGLFAIDTTTHTLHEKGFCIPTQTHNV